MTRILVHSKIDKKFMLFLSETLVDAQSLRDTCLILTYTYKNITHINISSLNQATKKFYRRHIFWTVQIQRE